MSFPLSPGDKVRKSHPFEQNHEKNIFKIFKSTFFRRSPLPIEFSTAVILQITPAERLDLRHQIGDTGGETSQGKRDKGGETKEGMQF